MTGLAALDTQLPIAAGTRTRCRGDVAMPQAAGIRGKVSRLVVGVRPPNTDVAKFSRSLLDLGKTLLDLARSDARDGFTSV